MGLNKAMTTPVRSGGEIQIPHNTYTGLLATVKGLRLMGTVTALQVENGFSI